jgi:hypothetical protein
VTRCRLPLFVVLGLFAAGGSSCPRMWQQYANPLPRQLPPTPTLQQTIEVINRNNSRIQSFSTNRASLSGSGFPTLRAGVAFERPRRFRLRASASSLTGEEFDLGSNDELFWFWVRRSRPPAVYYCRHEQFAGSSARQMIPIEPAWLVEALGVAEFDPALPHQGPSFLPNDRLRIDTVRDTPDGPMTKVTILDGSQGWILEQHWYDARRRLVASSVAAGHRRDPLSGLAMPAVVQIQCPSAQMAMRIDLGNVEINRPAADASALWTMPNYPDVPLVDIGDPHFRPPTDSTPAPVPLRRPVQTSRRP